MNLGSLIQQCSGGNEDGKYGVEDVRGISVNKQFIGTKANLSGVNLNNYSVVRPKCFSFVTVTSRNGGVISIAYNDSNEAFIVSSFYVTFELNQLGKELLLEDYLFMFFKRSEFDRYARRDSWGSAREYFYFDNMCNVEIDIPPLDIQKKYVDIYRALIANQTCYEQALDDLKLVCDAALDRCKYSDKHESLGNLVSIVDRRNDALTCKSAHGIRVGQGFIPSVASSQDLSKYKLVKPGQIACNLLHVGRDGVFPIAVNHSEKEIAVSPAYCVFEANSIPADYIAAWFSRDEIGRLGWFISDDNIRSGMAISRFFDMVLPVPEKTYLRAVLELESVLRTRKRLCETLKQLVNDVCPVLIKGSIEAARR
jgi:type I restriction enzyme S subunit